MFLFDLGSKAGAAITAAQTALKASSAPNLQVAKDAILKACNGWDPVFSGSKILTPGLRAKLADALGHMAYNMHQADKKGSLL